MTLPQGGRDLHVPAVHLQGLCSDEGALSYTRQGVGKGGSKEAGIGEFLLLLLTMMAILIITVMVGILVILSMISHDST